MTRLVFPPLFATLFATVGATLSLAGTACGDPPPGPKKPPAADGKIDPTKADPKTGPQDPGGSADGTPSGGSAGTGGADSGAWETEGDLPDLATSGAEEPAGESGATAAATGGAEPTPTGHPGPCKVTWSSGTVARFVYTEDTGGTIEINADGKGKPEVCAKFELTDGKPSKVTLDEGCDDKVDQEITTKYVADQNLATATVVDKGTGKRSKMTLVTLPSFTGVVPGYPMRAAKRSIGLTMRDGLIRTANVKKPTEGPTLKALFYYDAAKRIRAVKEDFEVDGTVDQRYDYRYDKDGNITRITLTVTGPEGDKAKTIGKLDYSCW